MKKGVLIFVFLSTISIPSYAGWRDVWKVVKKVAGDIVVGVIEGEVDRMVAATGNQETINQYNNLKQDYYSPNQSYGSTAGHQVTQGDYSGAVVSALSEVAVAAGVDEKVVALGNSGVNNWLNGDKNAAAVDVTQAVTRVAMGDDASMLDPMFDSRRTINQINSEYRNNLQNGMSRDEATRIRNEKIGKVITSIYFDAKEAHDEAQREKARRKREMLRDGIMQRGYNEMEANYYSSMIDLSEVNANDPSSIVSVLNMYNIAYKETSDTGAFFDDGFEVPDPVIEEKEPPIVEEKPIAPVIPPKPVDPSADAKARLKEIAPDRYLLNHVGLNKTQRETLDEVALLMNQYPNIRICLNGNTCDLGSDYINGLIAIKRANHAKDYLVKKGIDASRIETESKASSDPVANGKTGEDRLQNRRVSITILED
jgi:hypothetical protein